MTVRVLLVDDQELVRTGFRMVLDAQEGIEVAGEAADGRAALEVLPLHLGRRRADGRPHARMDGIEATRHICAMPDCPKVIILTTFDLDEYAFAALKAGAAGFLLKDAGPEQLIEAIRAVSSGDAVVAPSTTRRLIDRFVQHIPDEEAASNGRSTRSPRVRARC